LIWTEKASLAKKVVLTVTQNGKEASMFEAFQAAVPAARRHGDLYFAALLDRECIWEAFGFGGQRLKRMIGTRCPVKSYLPRHG
jgi:hypothetical protein